MKEIYRVATTPQALTQQMVTGEHYRITVLTPGLLRLEYSDDGVFEDRATQMVWHRDFQPADYRVIHTEDGIEIHTEMLQLIYNEKEFSANGLSIQVKGNLTAYHSIWRYGEPITDLGGTARTLDEADGAVPLDHGVASRNGFSVLDDSRSQVLLDDGWIETRKKGVKDLYFFGYGHNYKQALNDFYYLCGKTPMNRLLQGDVGSGKTLVAAAAIWFAAQNGWQSALLAPTEILARQHAATLADRLEPFGVNVTLLVGGMKAAERRVALAAIADGRAGLVVGTHAVLTDQVVFKNLGLAIVDEQHRFGVRQRGLLAGKAQSPHLLVMSATPIPRTLGLLLYGDLDISVLDELPPGRKPVKTWFITGKKRRDMYGFLDKQIAAGHQVYIVCPAIEENELDAGMKAVKQYYAETACALLPNRRVGLLHGKLKPREKDEIMQKFKAGELDVLVSTTVIEVGVDVPNATVMVIENAERFGLSALHQLRGRVGRGAADSCCILISDNENQAVRERLHFLCRTADGFAVARYDLETRGPGDFFGEAQHGLPTLQVADLVQDTRTLRVAQAEAKALLETDPNLADPAHRALSDAVERLFATAGALN